jgi:pseudaminic acid cytidylyltransferase
MVSSGKRRMIYALVLARSGSKRLPGKNIKPFLSQPMLVHTIQKLISWGLIDSVYLTTDCPNYADLGKKAGALVPFIRDKDLADEHTSTLEVVQDFIHKMGKQISDEDVLLAVYPCTPLLKQDHVCMAYSLLLRNHDSIIFPCLKYGHPIQRAFSIDLLDSPIFLNPSAANTRTQDLQAFYHDAGQFYMATNCKWKRTRNMHLNSKVLPFPMGTFVDIDTDEDWKLAEMLFKMSL